MTQIIITIITILFGINVFKVAELLKDTEKGDIIMKTILNIFIKENNIEKEILMDEVVISVFLCLDNKLILLNKKIIIKNSIKYSIRYITN